MKNRINRDIKFREDFRPFAPIVLAEYVHEYFHVSRFSPYMLLVGTVHNNKRRIIPEVTHVDGSARLQTVQDEDNNFLYNLLNAFHKETGVPVLINTSFNRAGEPIVEPQRMQFSAFYLQILTF